MTAAAFTFDTYALIGTLKDAGIPEQQAKAQIDAMTKIVGVAREQIEHDHKLDDVATKRDLADTKAELTRTILTVGVGVGLAQLLAIFLLFMRMTGKV
jgi:hypothetical protein